MQDLFSKELLLALSQENHLFLPSNIILMLIIISPLLSTIYVYLAAPLQLSRVYNNALYSSVISFLLSLFLWSSMEELKGGFQ